MEEEGAFSKVWRFLKPQMGASRTSVLSLRLSVVSLCSVVSQFDYFYHMRKIKLALLKGCLNFSTWVQKDLLGARTTASSKDGSKISDGTRSMED
jgi:hypothetical protein